MRKYVLAVAAIVFGAATFTFGATAAPASPSNTPSTATAPALPADQIAARELSARTTLQQFFQAMFAGDQSAALSLLEYTDRDASDKPKSKEKAETMFGEVLAEQRLRKAVTAAFGNVPFKVGQSDAEIAAFNKGFDTATTKVSPDGNSATITMPLGNAYTLVWKDGKWLIDFDKTQAGIGPLPVEEDLGALAKMTKAYDQLAADVAAKKFGSVDDVTKEVEKIQAASKMKAVETAPAAGIRN